MNEIPKDGMHSKYACRKLIRNFCKPNLLKYNEKIKQRYHTTPPPGKIFEKSKFKIFQK
jgi:hypothetical protein